MLQAHRKRHVRSLASKFFFLTAILVLWAVAVVIVYDFRHDSMGFGKGLLLCLVVLLVSGAISRMTTRLLARPLQLLSQGIESVRKGRLEPVQVSRTGDEIEYLGESFNSMIEALAESQRELRSMNEQLEERIRQRTEQLEIAMQQALAANRAKSEFLANISHELRTPMNGVLGMMDIVLESSLNPEQRESLETAQRCAYSLLTVLNDVLDLSKIEAGHMVIETIRFDIRTLLEDCVKTQATVAAQKGIDLRSGIDPQFPRYVEGDPLRLRQVLLNLLSNAVKFTEKGWVGLSVRGIPSDSSDSVGLELVVADTGIGIPASHQAYIFDTFTQADSSISRRFGGTGLGLAITRRLIEMQGGTIAVTSRPGEGSTFTVTLKYRRATAPSGVFVPAPAGETKGSGNLLVVEDNLVNQRLVQTMLSKQGYSVVLAGNGREALRTLEERPFRLVLMDVQMPDMDGFETTRRMRQDPRWRHLPIVAMTARAMQGDRELCIAAGMNGFVSKPIDRSHLISVVEEFALPADHTSASV